MRGSRSRLARVFVAAWLLAGCVQSDLEMGASLAPLDAAYFRCEVEPVLIKRCAFGACHGSELRPFRVYAPRRLRSAGAGAGQLTDAEHQANFDMARGFANDAQGAPLLQLKPLATGAGGYFHRGALVFGGGDSFTSIDDPGYKAIVRWARDQVTAAPDCVPSEEMGP